MIENNHATLPAVVVDWVTAFKEETGKEPHAQSIRIASAVCALGVKMADWGYADSQEGREPESLSHFEELMSRVMEGRGTVALELGSVLAQGFYENYMTGYNGESK